MEWEAGDIKRGRVAGVAQGRGKGGASGKRDGLKADGTPDKRLKANRVGHGGGGGGGMPQPAAPPPPDGGSSSLRTGLRWIKALNRQS